MDSALTTDNWPIFESEDERAAEYADFDEQIELDPVAAARHREFVRRVGEEFGFPIPRWVPTIPSHERARR